MDVELVDLLVEKPNVIISLFCWWYGGITSVVATDAIRFVAATITGITITADGW